MISDTVKSIIFILIKVAVILALSFVVFFAWCFIWMYIQSNALLAAVTQVVTENNYLPRAETASAIDSGISGEETRNIRSQIEAINNSIHFDVSDDRIGIEERAGFPMGIDKVTIANNTAGTPVTTTIDHYGNRAYPAQSRPQSGDLITVTVAFRYPTIKFLFGQVASGSGYSVLNFAEHETHYEIKEIQRQTIGMKYYPDILPGEYGITY